MKGNDSLVPICYVSPVASAQLKSAILLAGLNIAGETTVIEKTHTRDHTERMLQAMGAELSVTSSPEGNHITLTGHPTLKAQSFTIPADPSSAAFLIVAVLITAGSQLCIRHVLMNEARTGLFTTLKEMGADITYENERHDMGEKVADIRVKSSTLKGVNVPPERAASMIDEYPILCVAAAFAQGITHMAGVEELRVKESDRLMVMVEGLNACGVDLTYTDDSITITGADKVGGGAVVNTHMDHRIAMSFLVLGLATERPVAIDDICMVNTSFPGFVALMNSCGARIDE